MMMTPFIACMKAFSQTNRLKWTAACMASEQLLNLVLERTIDVILYSVMV